MNSIALKIDEVLKQEQASFVKNITNDVEYEQAIQLFEELIEDDEHNQSVVTLLVDAINRYESSLPEIVAFDTHVDTLDPGVSLLRILMDQHTLKAKDLAKELGSKSNVSLILSGQRNLTTNHMRKLALRFGIEPGMFL
ncbi:MAG TPA: transcriptional regulator [Oceanospirillaceae bacterium]|nr:transcriptional regulator [Oceanospirillaceae bacterium]